jgi:hypothetical protein
VWAGAAVVERHAIMACHVELRHLPANVAHPSLHVGAKPAMSASNASLDAGAVGIGCARRAVLVGHACSRRWAGRCWWAGW